MLDVAEAFTAIDTSNANFVSQHHSSGLLCYQLFKLSAKSSSGTLQGTIQVVASLLVSSLAANAYQQLIEHMHIFTQSTPSIISYEACKEAISHKEFMYMYPSLPDPPSLHARVWFRDYMFICECSCFLMVAMQSSQIITTQLPIVTITFGVAYKQFNLGEIDREKHHAVMLSAVFQQRCCKIVFLKASL